MALCFFIGHHDAAPHLFAKIETAVNDHITEHGVTEFVVGQFGAFDRMAARAVINAKNRFPNVSLSILLPYHPSERGIRAPEGYDSTIYPPGKESVPRRFAIVQANQYIIKHCDFLIAYAWQQCKTIFGVRTAPAGPYHNRIASVTENLFQILINAQA